MNRNFLVAGILIIAAIAVALGAYWYQLRLSPAIQSAESYLETTLPTEAIETESTTENSAAVPTKQPTNPPLSTGSSLKDIENDLNQTVIEEEIFTDL